ncbi:hypothetical protein OUZ56_002663 [Daphnia magna]|uniref:Uncharacterized protein n=1 Tax=Daphnia magna TaxID=35525 RepID=A0ABR0A6S3_9CRUS|nr:hypothetical protein OUZ56_002663 [Daphnia magna]
MNGMFKNRGRIDIVSISGIVYNSFDQKNCVTSLASASQFHKSPSSIKGPAIVMTAGRPHGRALFRTNDGMKKIKY